MSESSGAVDVQSLANHHDDAAAFGQVCKVIAALQYPGASV